MQRRNPSASVIIAELPPVPGTGLGLGAGGTLATPNMPPSLTRAGSRGALVQSVLSGAHESMDALKDYARDLLRSCPTNDLGVRSHEEAVDRTKAPGGLGLILPNGVPSPMRSEEREDEGPMTGCREAVEILTRNLKKSE